MMIFPSINPTPSFRPINFSHVPYPTTKTPVTNMLHKDDANGL